MDLTGICVVEDDQHCLIVSFDPTQAAASPAIDPGGLRSFADAQGYAELSFDDRSIQAAVASIRRGERCAVAIARRTDAEYRVEVAPHRMSAWLTVIGAHGGKPASALDAVVALGAQNVREGVDAAAVESAVQNCGQRQEVARGTAPKPGKDAVLEPLVNVNRQRHPRIDPSGLVDFHDLGAIPSVLAGEPVMRRHPPAAGIAGVNVCGEVLPAPAGRDSKFAVRLQGVVVSPNDPDLLLAEISGQPLLQRDGISVEPIVRYQEIDLAAGNIEFPGSIEVKGDIHSGMKVQAGGDISVNGVIESAEVSAGGDIKVQGGIIGHSPTQHSDPQAAVPGTALIRARGSVSARFVENAFIEAQQRVHVAESIVQSDIVALDQVVVGDKGRKGHILGGLVQATALVSADFLGGEGAAPTRVMVGVNPLLQRALDEHKRRLSAKLKEHDDVSKVIKVLRGQPQKRPIYDKARLTLQKITEEIGEEMEQERVIEASAKLAENAKIVVGEQVSAGVTVLIGRRTRFVNEDLGRGVFHLDEGGEIGYGALARGKS